MESKPKKSPVNQGHANPRQKAAENSADFGENSSNILGRFSDVAILAADWFWEMDSNLRFTYQSERFEQVTGMKIADVIGKTREEAFAGLIDDAEKWRSLGENLLLQNDYEMVWSLKLSDGSIRILRTTGKPFYDNQGEFQGYRGVGSDITESIKISEALEASEARFRDFDQIAADWFFELDENLHISYMSGEIHLPTGKKVSELIGLNELDWFLGHFGDGEIWRDYRRRLLAREPFEIEYHWEKEDGSEMYIHNFGKPVFDANRVFQGYRCCGTDKTRQRLAETTARENEQRFRDFAETAADWFWEQDADLRFTYVTGEFVGKKYNIERDMYGKTRQELFPDIDFNAPNWQYIINRQAAREPFSNFEYEFRPRGSDPIYIRISGKPFYDENGVFKGYRGSGNDITEAYKLSQQLSYQAAHDPLTNLLNRREFEHRMLEALRECREEMAEHALCYLDLDQFKVVNDSCGHEGGDRLLQQITSILKSQVRVNDIVARLGGDEFGVLLKNCPIKQSSAIAENIRRAIDEYRYIDSGKAYRVGCSIGLIPLNSSSRGYTDVMREADTACYAAKDAGRNRVHIYHEDNPEVFQRHQEMQNIVEINRAYDENRFLLYRQAIQHIQTDSEPAVTFFEVLLRMKSSSGEIVSPGSFLPVAERYNLITQLDSWVVKKVIEWLCLDRDETKGTICSINLSGTSIASESFLIYILDLIESSKVETGRICFEITETSAISNIDVAMHFINKLKEKGCYFALDDFGSGFSSFAYLKTLPVDFLKIDGLFVRDILQDPINFELVKSINDIGHVTGKKTIAEFVEDTETLVALKDIGIDYAQGYAIDFPAEISFD